MRRIHKYKAYSRLDVGSKFPKRLLNLKRPKWGPMKEDLKVMLMDEDNFNLVDSDVIVGETFGWNRISRTYKSRLEFYSSLFAQFDQSLKIKRLKSYRTLSRFDNYVKHFAEGYFKTTTLLWASYFFKSTYEAKQSIDFSKVIINNGLGKSNELLRSGSVVSVLDENFDLKKNIMKYSENTQILSFLEVDYYSQDLILIKDKESISEDDLNLLIIDSLSLSTL